MSDQLIALERLSLHQELHQPLDAIFADEFLDEGVNVGSKVVRYLFHLADHFLDLFLGPLIGHLIFLCGLPHELGGLLDDFGSMISLLRQVTEYELITLQVLVVEVGISEEALGVGMLASGLVDVVDARDEHLLLLRFEPVVHRTVCGHLELAQAHRDEVVDGLNLLDVLDLEHLGLVRVQIYLNLHQPINI